ncbi:IS3 family transposase [Spiroplasma endosymbiont of Aleiodes alternator]|uniref:IS3 family transposase n=1 Tax=Spiroplasma endosymbiont of Aleiodes alternator TaxID=3139329 RepID=UPI003CCAB62F
MAKWLSKEEKLKIIKISKIKTIDKTALEYGIGRSSIKEWIKAYKLLGEKGLEYGNGIRAKKTKRTGRPKSLNFNEMTKQELIEYIEAMNDIKKYLEKSTKKKKYFVIFSLKKKYQISYLCWLLNVSKSGYYKWIKNGMNEFNKWDTFLANIIKNIFYEFQEIYGYKMITLWINKIYNLKLKFHIVYRYMKNMSLKAKIRIKKFDYRTKSGSLRYDNLLKRDFSTTNLNEKLGTDITYLLTNGKTYYLSIVKYFHNNEILDYKISASLDMTFVVQNIIQAWVNAQKPTSWILQSDQGFHYTNPSYKILCDELKIKISMSRRGNSCDNGATETWFGTMKTEFLYQIPRKNRTIEWIQDNLPKYIYFYNNYRPQIKLKEMSPIEYRLAHSKPTNNYFIPINTKGLS